MGRRIQAYLCRVDRDQLYRKTINALNDLKKGGALLEQAREDS
jgi:hypothetical protein